MANEYARDLRRRMTDAEMRLWFRLRPLRRDGLAFRRQSPVGRYVLDFECRAARVAVEVDGSQHGDARALIYDDVRSLWLEARDYRVLRFWNGDVLRDTDEIVHEIVSVTEERLRLLGRR